VADSAFVFECGLHVKAVVASFDNLHKRSLITLPNQ